MSANARPLKYRELYSRLTKFGVIEKRFGAGSCRMLHKAGIEGRDQSYPIHPHGEGDEIDVHIVRAILRRFKIDPNEFWAS